VRPIELNNVLRSVVRLYFFSCGVLRMSQEEFDVHFDTLLELLEEVNNEKHRITPKD